MLVYVEISYRAGNSRIAYTRLACSHSSELAAEAIPIIERSLTLRDVAGATHPHPINKQSDTRGGARGPRRGLPPRVGWEGVGPFPLITAGLQSETLLLLNRPVRKHNPAPLKTLQPGVWRTRRARRSSKPGLGRRPSMPVVVGVQIPAAAPLARE